MTGLSARLIGGDGPADVSAPSGRYYLDEDRLTVAGPVVARSASGYRLDSAEIAVDLRNRRIATAQPVSGRLPIGSFRAGSLNADIAGRTMVLTGGVHLRISGRKGRASP
jgi:lipopolysaccharide export system protein LptC